ncbi:MAG: LysR substrate-binding domain-containing protein [Limimaricola soesokkakensis]|uniref:LysR substrate-binding domain-containing protein n=1 Tax=Limimaricola soesokkakensis TaxID=1343159 RepID=UPI0040593C14
MTRSLRHLNSLRAFEAAARHSSLAKAASELNVSHSVVSQHVRNLETWFGTALFVRHGNRVELSETGRALRPQIASGLQTLTDACEAILRKSQAGTLVVSAEPALASLWLRKQITRFQTAFPRIEVDLRPAWSPDRIDDGQVDMIIHFATRMQASGVERSDLFPIDGYPAATPQVRHGVQSAQGDVDWAKAELVHDNGKETWQKWFAAHEPDCDTWRKGRVYSDLSLTIAAAVDGEGVILADDILCAQDLASGRLTRLDDRAIRCVWYQVAVPRGAARKAASETFRDWLLEQTTELRE